ncbi:hypothetical protein DFH07DRAFT_938517 [Mycena maculata]|uniref:Uncharacterized protein n=1 Tax=Mycena maculata TaxID=230809 RepID=A0AAD7JME1_9AGAR|nr:hypothetical protein DFH07DRAFT_938517 [Mycena maculata]
MYIRRRPPNPHIVHHPRVAPAHRSCLVGVVSGRSMTGSKGDELGVSRGSDALRKPIYGHGKECVNTGEEVRPETEKGNTRWAREDASSRWASGGCEWCARAFAKSFNTSSERRRRFSISVNLCFEQNDETHKLQTDLAAHIHTVSATISSVNTRHSTHKHKHEALGDLSAALTVNSMAPTDPSNYPDFAKMSLVKRNVSSFQLETSMLNFNFGNPLWNVFRTISMPGARVFRLSRRQLDKTEEHLFGVKNQSADLLAIVFVQSTPSLTTGTMQEFPQELVDATIEAMDSDSDESAVTNALLACSLVCHRWSMPVQAQLMRDVSVTGTSQLMKFHRMLAKGNFCLTIHVENLVVYFQDGESDSGHRQSTAVLLSLSNVLTVLGSLSIASISPRREDGTLPQTLCSGLCPILARSSFSFTGSGTADLFGAIAQSGWMRRINFSCCIFYQPFATFPISSTTVIEKLHFNGVPDAMTMVVFLGKVVTITTLAAHGGEEFNAIMAMLGINVWAADDNELQLPDLACMQGVDRFKMTVCLDGMNWDYLLPVIGAWLETVSLPTEWDLVVTLTVDIKAEPSPVWWQ